MKPGSTTREGRAVGFTLVEVVMALAITATAILVLLALLPYAADAIADSHRSGRAQSCLELVLADVSAAKKPEGEDSLITPRMGIVLPDPGQDAVQTIYFDDNGVPSDPHDALFRVTLDLRRSGLDPAVMNIDGEARWPATEGSARAGSVNIWGVREL